MSFTEHQLAHQNANTLSKVIGLAFHDGPSNNLDYYVLTETTTIQNSSLLYNAPYFYHLLETFEWPLTIASKEEPFYKFNLTKTLYLQPYGLRGPPYHDFYV